MSEESAILAQFSDWRTVKGRKVLQLIFEVPLEEQAKVLTHLGAPMPLADLWCGIARVARKGKAGGEPRSEASTAATGHVIHDDGSSSTTIETFRGIKPKRRWQDMPASQRAALWIKEPDAWAYIREACGSVTVDDEVAADAWLKRWLEIKSKSDLDADPILANRFKLTEGKYQAWRQARGHGVI